MATTSLTVGLIAPVTAGAAPSPVFPEVIPLPQDWQAEGIAAGPGTTVYAGSLGTGAIYRADLRTGAGEVLVPAQDDRVSVGLKHSRGLLYVAGGPGGRAYVYDADTGTQVEEFDLGAGFVNDVTVTRDAAWFTDSFSARLNRVDLRHGRPTGQFTTLELGGDWSQVPGAFVFNANGIAATPDGSTLIVINSTLGQLYQVDPETGEATQIAADTTLTAGDGILLRGRDLAVVRNRFNEIALLELSPDLQSAVVKERLTDPDFAVPTTVASFAGTLYAVNARFSLPPGPYSIVKVDGTGPGQRR